MNKEAELLNDKLSRLNDTELKKYFKKNKRRYVVTQNRNVLEVLKTNKNYIYTYSKYSGMSYYDVNLACNKDFIRDSPIFLDYDVYKTLFNNRLKIPIEQRILKSIGGIFIDYYGEDRVDVFLGDDNTIVVIHYPEITITNSIEDSITVKDAFVRFKFYLKDGKIYHYKSLVRATYTEAEWHYNYSVSHVSDSNTWCFGNSVLSGFFNKGDGKLRIATGFTFSDIKSIPYLLDEFLAWESLEGVPYHFIAQAKLSYRKASALDSSIGFIHNYRNKIITLSEKFLETIDNVRFESKGEDVILTNTYLDTVLTKLAIELNYTDFLYCIDSNDNVFTPRRFDLDEEIVLEAMSNDLKDILINGRFKGRHIEPKLIPTPFVDNTTKVIHPFIRQIIGEQVNKKLNKFLEQYEN